MKAPIIDFKRVLEHAHIAELPNPSYGKVRDCYDLPDNRRILIASDRLSAFDRILATIPYKGQVLTQTARYWFEKTADICPNHVLEYPDPNVVVGRRLSILPVEVVVRGYLAGTTSTSLLARYKKGERSLYGHTFPDSLRDNQALPAPILTPTSKAAKGGHDEPLSGDEVIARKLMSAEQWEQVSSTALALFARGQKTAAERGLILVDTKYEFGIDDRGSDDGGRGTIVLADEIHTPDSSRFWLAEGYQEALETGQRPPSYDKDILRAWVCARCDPYKEPIPEIPADRVEATCKLYMHAFEAITGTPFVPDTSGETPLARVRANLARYGR